MNEAELTRPELIERIEKLRAKISELESQDMSRRQGDKARLDELQTKVAKTEEELQLRYSQLKASEEEMKDTRKRLKEIGDKHAELQEQFTSTERLLHESEGHYRHLAENVPGMLAIQDIAAKKYVYWNRDIGWSGYTLDEWNQLSGDVKKKLIHNDDLPRYVKLYQEWEKVNYYKPLRLTYRVRHKDGYFRWIEAFFFKEFAEDNTVIAQVEVSWDITEQKESESAVKQRDERIALLSDGVTDLVYRTDGEERYTFVSPSFCRAFGKTEDELLGKKFAPPVHQDDFDSTRQVMDQLTRPPNRSEVEQRVLTSEGWRWIHWSVSARVDENGKIESIGGVGADVTDRKRIEEELAKLQTEFNTKLERKVNEMGEANAKLVQQLNNLKAAEGETLATRAGLQTMLNAVKGSLFELDKAGKVKGVNSEMLAKLGMSEEQVLQTLANTEQVSEANRRNRNNLTMLFNALEEMIFVTDATGRILHVNETAAQRLGLAIESLAGSNILELYPPNRRDEASAILAEAVAGKTRGHAIPLLAKDKTLLPVETRMALGRWDNSNAIIASARDASANQVERGKLGSVERRYKMIADDSPVGLAVIQKDLLRFANPQFAAMVEYSGDEINNWAQLDIENIVHPADRDDYIRSLRAMRKRGGSGVSHFVFRITTKTGLIKWLSDYVKTVNFEGAPAEMHCYLDATEFHESEVASRRSEIEAALSGKTEALEHLSGAVAHDFNELLTIITGHAMMGLMTLHEGDPIRKDLDEINKAAELGSALTWKLLTCAGRHETDAIVLQPNTIIGDVSKVLHRVLGKAVELEVHQGAGLWTVKCDPKLLEQVIINLANNSRDAIAESGRVTISTDNFDPDTDVENKLDEVPPGQYVRLTFSDTGKGITRDILPRIFDPFFTTKSAKGAGLGLSIVQGIVRKGGGFIFVDSQPGKGTTFRIYFPRLSGEPARATIAPKAEPRMRTGTVLVVEDDDAVREMASQILKWHGYKVLEARSGKDALAIAEKLAEPVDVVVSDVYMPNMGGAELIERIRQMWKGVKVMYMSGGTGDKALAPDVPMLRKPFPPMELVNRVEELLG